MIVVVGAGLAGLSAAITLEEAGQEVLLVDGSDRAGGRVASDILDGFILDRGFQLINANYPELKRLNVINHVDFIEAPRAVRISIEGKESFLGDPRRHSLRSGEQIIRNMEDLDGASPNQDEGYDR